MQQIPLSKGLFALVSDEDYEWLMQWKWSASEESRDTKFYAVRRERIDGKLVKFRMHVEIIKRRGIEIPPGHVVDHVNHNSLDNRFGFYEVNPVMGEVIDTNPPWVQQLEVITQVENMQRSKGWKKKGVKSGPNKNPRASGKRSSL